MQPPETIALKLLHAAPQRLQRMLMRLQKHNIELRCKKGCNMFFSGTLSRAFLELEGVDHSLLPLVSEAQ